MRFFAAVIDGRFLRFFLLNLIFVRLSFFGIGFFFLPLLVSVLGLLILLSFVRLFTVSSVIGVVERLVG